MPKLKDALTVIGTVRKKGAGYEFQAEEVRRGDAVILGRAK